MNPGGLIGDIIAMGIIFYGVYYDIWFTPLFINTDDHP